jgi:hypothetical protein
VKCAAALHLNIRCMRSVTMLHHSDFFLDDRFHLSQVPMQWTHSCAHAQPVDCQALDWQSTEQHATALQQTTGY